MALSANELRIGNWYTSVKSKIDVPVKCELTDFTQLDVMSDGAYNDPPIDEMFEPIPLTKEWLLKFGFRKTFEYDRNIYRKGNIVLVGGVLFYFQWTKLDYIHQLQNLYFSLTGKELTIK